MNHADHNGELFFVDSPNPSDERVRTLPDGRSVDWTRSQGVVVTLPGGEIHRYAPAFKLSTMEKSSEGGHAYAVVDGALQVQSHEAVAFTGEHGGFGIDIESGGHGIVRNTSARRVLRTYAPGAWVQATGETDEPLYVPVFKKTFVDE